MTTAREKQLEDILAKFLEPAKDIPFEVVIKALYGASVERFDQQTQGNSSTLRKIVKAMRQACRAVQENPIERERPNEVGNDMELFVVDALRGQGMDASPAKTKSGRGKSTGYPDVKIMGLPVPIYLEVKSYGTTIGSTMRSFYLSPAENHKVDDDGHHLLVGFEIERNENLYTPVAFKLADLYGLACDMKAEFNSSNTRLYDPDRMLHAERVKKKRKR